MTFLGLASKNAWRKPGRTILLIVSVTIAFALYAVLQAFLNGASGAAVDQGRLVVANGASAAQSLPVRYLDTLETLDGVDDVAFSARMRGFVGTEDNIAVVTAVDPERGYRVFGQELGLDPAMIEGLSAERDALLVGQMLARAMGWQVGDRVSITGFHDVQKDGSRNWAFTVAGIFPGKTASTDTYFAIAEYGHFNAMRQNGADTVKNFVVIPAEGVDPQSLAPKIDAQFANSPYPTRTQSEKQFLQSFMRQIGDLKAVVGMVVAAALITIFMIVVNTMAFAVRERTFEIGVLKSIGLSRHRIMSLILSESLLVFTIGGALGGILGWIACRFADPSIGLVFSVAGWVNIAALTLGLGLLSGLLPALNAMRLPIVQTFKAR